MNEAKNRRWSFKRRLAAALALLGLIAVPAIAGTIQLPTSGTFSGLTEQGYINTALAQLVALLQSGSAPTTTSTGLSSTAGVVWHDTVNNQLKIRDQADTTWIAVGSFDENGKLFQPYSIGIVGAMRNVLAQQASATTLTFQADEVVVAASLGGQCYRLGSVGSLTLNLAATGANGMDTALGSPGAVDLSVYLIYNPTAARSGTNPALLGVLGSTSNGSVYSGAHMPSGYTASALVGSYKLNSSSQLNDFVQRDRVVAILSTSILVGGSSTSPAAINISAAVPANAIAVSGTMTPSAGESVSIYADSSGIGQQEANGSGASITPTVSFSLLLRAAQTLYYSVNGGTGAGATVSGYSF